MTVSDQTRYRSSSGYTLLELLVVMAVMALVACVTVPSFSGHGSDGVRLGSAVQVVTGAIRTTRAAAILRDMQTVLVIDADKRLLSSRSIPEQRLSADITVRIKLAGPERLSDSRGGIRFYPDGTSTGGDIKLLLHKREARICVNWLTGEPQLGSEC